MRNYNLLLAAAAWAANAIHIPFCDSSCSSRRRSTRRPKDKSRIAARSRRRNRHR